MSDIQNPGIERDSLGTRLWHATYDSAVGREVRLILGGVAGAAIDSPIRQTGLQMVESLGAGIALGVLQRSCKLGWLAAQTAGAVLALECLNGALDWKRWSAASGAMANAWRSNKSMESDMAVMKASVGRFVVDSTLMFSTGMLGSKLGQLRGSHLRGIVPERLVIDPNKGLGLRILNRSHLDELTRIDREAFGVSLGEDWFLGFVDKRKRFGVVADLAGKPVGYMTCVLQKDQLYLSHIAVDSASRGQGVGRHMMSWLINELPRLKRSKIELSVDPANVGARRLYQSLGFEINDSHAMQFRQKTESPPK